MNILLIGSGGREHALAWAMSRSGDYPLYIAPGNPGTEALGTNVKLDISDHAGVAEFCRQSGIGLVVVGPENPLAEGIADYLRPLGFPVFGPGKAGAMLESSKDYGMKFMQEHGIPHAGYWTFTDEAQAVSHVNSTSGPWVIKADGLALGKGVVITSDREEALETLSSFFSGKAHGDAGRKVVFQEYLEGLELTAMALTDGKCIFPLPFARDHKRVYDGGKGPNTGGMGAFCPVPLDHELELTVLKDVLNRTFRGLRAEGIDYRGLIFAGLMMTANGPKMLEYNVRFGDPETECVLPLIKGDFTRALLACAEGRLDEFMERTPLTFREGACAAIIVASGGYPGSYPKGLPISGLSQAEDREWKDDPPVFHAGTSLRDGEVVTSGGRVLAVPALGSTIEEAGKRAYARIAAISFEGAHFRKDIVDDVH